MSAPDDPGIAWIRLTEAANAAFCNGDLDTARHRWQQAQQLAETEFSPRDPRRAAGIGNLACASYAAGDYRESERLCQRALAAWRDAEDWLHGMCLENPARSSTFHLRLRQKHRRRYDRPRLEKYRRLLAAGNAAARNNLGETLRAAGRPEEARALCARALAEREGAMQAANLAADAGLAMDAGLTIIRRNLASLTAAEQRAVEQAMGAGDAVPSASDAQTPQAADAAFLPLAEGRRWIVDSPPVITDEGALMSSLLLAQVLECKKA
ncbi:MAG: tetratricopeptide repeat protein [Gammaproteobacteria bacterium]|nr:tetratricopeptide repeat protein [Gammaproteobacteria bacterium]